MGSFYLWIKFIHVLAGFTFLLAHGTAVSLSFRLKHEKEPERIRAMLDLSAVSWPAMMLSLLALLAAGIALSFMMHYWDRGWVWLSLGILLAQTVWMGVLGQGTYHVLRKMVGLPYMARGGPQEAEPPRPSEEIQAHIAKTRPMEMLVIGMGGFAIILWLMMFKPF